MYYIGKKKTRGLKILAAMLASILLVFFVLPQDALARRSASGGGELAKFGWSDFGKTAGIALLSYGVSSWVGSQLTSTPISLNNAFSASNMIQGYNTYMATSQVSRAVGMAGAYHDWDPQLTFALSTVATSATTGFLNPELALGEQVNPTSLSAMGKGALVGTLGGAAQGFTITAIDGDRIDDGEGLGIGSQIAGLAAGTMATSLGRKMFDPRLGSHGTVEILGKDTTKPQPTEYNLNVGEQTYEIKENTTITTKYGEELTITGIGKNGSLDCIGKVDGTTTYHAEGIGLSELNAQRIGGEIVAIGPKPGEPVYRPITGADSKGIHFGEPIAASQINQMYRDRGYEFETIGPGIVKVTDPGRVGADVVAGRLLKATFVDTFDRNNWPVLATQAVGIWAAGSIKDEDKQYLQPLVKGLAEGVSHSLFRGLANTYGLDPARFIGSKYDKIGAQINYHMGIRQMAQDVQGARNYKKITNIHNEYKTDQYDYNTYIGKLEGVVEKIGEDLDREIEFQPFQRDLVKLSPDQIEKRILEDVPKDYFQNLTPEKREMVQQQARQLTDQLAKRKIDIAELNRNMAITRAQQLYGVEIMKPEISTSDVLEIAGTNQGGIFGRNLWSGVRFALFDGLVRGGLQSIVAKNLDLQEDSPAKQLLLTYAANMGTAVARGVAWHRGWEPAGLNWSKKWDFPEPKKDFYSKRPSDSDYDLIQHNLAQDAYERTRKKYDRFIELGFEPVLHRERVVWDFEKGKLVRKPCIEATAVFPDERPSLAGAIGASILQANMDFGAGAFSFGYPTKEPEHTTALDVVNYTGYLGYISNLSGRGGHLPLLSGARSGNIGATSKNLGSTVAQSPTLCNLFQIQPQRFVRIAQPISGEQDYSQLKDVPNYPYTVQSLGVRGGIMTESRFWMPFPDPSYGIRPQTGEAGFLLRMGLPK